MAVDYNKYQKLVLRYSYNGVTWTNVKPEQYKKGEIIEANSYECGYVDPIYRMVQLPSTDYMCINQSKYYKLRQQVSYDDGATWEDVVPYVEEPGNVLEENSYDCDYGVTWKPVDEEYYCQMAIVPANYCDATSNCPSDMYFNSQSVMETFSLPDSTSDYARYFIHPHAIFRSDGYLISCDNNGKILYNGWIQNRLAIDSTYLAKNITTSSYVNTNVVDIINDEMYIWTYCTRASYYYWNVSKVNIKTGVFTILNDSGTPSSTRPWQTTNDEKNIMSDVNYIFTDGTKLYKITRYHYNGYTSTGTLLKTWDFSGNNYSQTVVFADAVPNSDKLTHQMANPGVFYLWEYFNDISAISGTIYRYDVNTDSEFTVYGVWFCDETELNKCPLPTGNYKYSRATNNGDIEIDFENYQVETTDTPLMRVYRLRSGGIVNKSYYFYNGDNSYPYALLVSSTYQLNRFSDGVRLIKNNSYKDTTV